MTCTDYKEMVLGVASIAGIVVIALAMFWAMTRD
jgi:hypothetical protein